MAQFTTRFNDLLVSALDGLAEQHGLSRNAFLEHLAEQAVRQGFVPIRPGEGLIAAAADGSKLILFQDFQSISIEQDTLNAAHQENAARAIALARKGMWGQARRVLENAGLTVTGVTR